MADVDVALVDVNRIVFLVEFYTSLGGWTVMIGRVEPVLDRIASGHVVIGDDEVDWFLTSLSLLDAVKETVIDVTTFGECSRDDRLTYADGVVLSTADVRATRFEMVKPPLQLPLYGEG